MQKPDLATSLGRAYKLMQRAYQQFAEMHGLAPAQLAALEKLWLRDGLTVSELGEELQLKTSTVTALADRMERDGLITRTRNESDRRVVTLHLTDRGMVLQREVPDFDAHLLAMLRAGMPEGYIKTLDHLLQQFADVLEES